MTFLKNIVWAIGIFGIVIFAVACGDDDDEGHASPAVANAAASAVGSAAESSSASASGSQRVAGGTGTAGTSQAAAPQLATASTEAGIWVTGTGEMSLAPDIALLRLGVETTSPSVNEARNEAANAMDAVVAAVKAKGLADEDIQTTSFNIWPQYDRQEVVTNGVRSTIRVLSGYTVSNNAVIKIRDLDEVGNIIDDVVDAGGDAARINGIDFSIEDSSQYTSQLREDAVNAALENAQYFATLTGVTLGKLVYVTEVSGAPVVQGIAESRAFAMPAAAAATSISGGSLDLMLTVRAGFAIE